MRALHVRTVRTEEIFSVLNYPLHFLLTQDTIWKREDSIIQDFYYSHSLFLCEKCDGSRR